MWEMILFVIVVFATGWYIRGIIDHKKRSQQTGEPEMMWFNAEKSMWERVTEMQLLVNDQIIVTVPVKLVEKSKKR